MYWKLYELLHNSQNFQVNFLLWAVIAMKKLWKAHGAMHSDLIYYACDGFCLILIRFGVFEWTFTFWKISYQNCIVPWHLFSCFVNIRNIKSIYFQRKIFNVTVNIKECIKCIKSIIIDCSMLIVQHSMMAHHDTNRTLGNKAV